VKTAATPLNLTEVVVKPVPLKFVPVIVTDFPTGPKVGVNDVIVGSGAVDTVKFVELVAVPEGLVTAIFPVVAPVGTVAVIVVEELALNVVAATPLKVTDVTPVKPVPVIVTELPTAPEVGVNEVIVTQLDETVKFVELRTSAPHVVTPILPVVAPAGTNALSWVGLTPLEVAAVPLKVTSPPAVELLKRFCPKTVTAVPTGPHVGVNEEILGAQPPGLATVKVPELVPVPAVFVAVITPVVPAPTVARICVAETMSKFAATVPPNFTLVTLSLLKLVPVIVTTQPAGPLVGVKELIVGVVATANAGTAKPTSRRPAIARTRPAMRLT
jgi:hypothetical protein